jgi:uncharacterized membrane protein YeaQ/YmgE (transglycosylase-associated protein family)
MIPYSDTELLEIARKQKHILRLIGACIILTLVPLISAPVAELIALVLFPAFLLIGLIGAVLIYQLANALKDPTAWLYVLLSFIPYVNCAVLLLLNMRATAVLKANSIDVGLLGAPDHELQPLANRSKGDSEKENAAPTIDTR